MFVLSLLVGLFMLVLGAELLVRGGGQLALALRIPALVVGLTVVAMGTSMPELMVSVTAAFAASTDMALANINGSNLANIALVLGGASLVRPMDVERSLLRREVPACIFLQVALLALCFDGVLSRLDGVLFLLFGIVYNVLLVRAALRGRAAPVEGELDASGGTPWYVNLFLVAAGACVLVFGANFFVSGAHHLATLLGLSDRFIGLTVVAVGTSAPELATGLVSAWRGESDIAVGNSLGSNLFNIVLVLGVTSIIHPIAVQDPGSFVDMIAALVVTLALIPIVLHGQLGRTTGVLLLLGYFAYLGADLLS